MAKFKPILGDLSGKIGDNVFSRNTFGAYVRRKASPVNPQTSWQLMTRGWLTDAARYYSETLTSAQRLQWTAWAALITRTDAFGSSYHLTGISAFVMCNNNRRKVITPWTWLPVPPPLSTVPTSPTSGVVTMGVLAQSVSVAFVPTPIPAKSYLLVFGSLLLAPGQSFVKSQYRYLDYAPAAAASPLVVSPRWIEHFGAFQTDEDYKFRIFMMSSDSWLISVPTQCSVVATP
jgi:hypothetical protein